MREKNLEVWEYIRLYILTIHLLFMEAIMQPIEGEIICAWFDSQTELESSWRDLRRTFS